MAYLNLDLDYFDHPKTKRLVGLLGRGAELLPLRLWSYCGKFHSADGRMTGYAEREIEALAGWWGKSGEMLGAMRTVRFMGCDEKGWFVENWTEHQGHIEALKERGKKMAEARWERVRRAADADSNAGSIATAMPRQCSFRTNQPTNRTVLPAKPGGGKVVGRGTVSKGAGEKGGSDGQARFAVPDFSEIPKPLYASAAREMLKAVDGQIRAIKRAAKKTPVKARTGEGTEFVASQKLEPEAEAAIAQWEKRREEINRALAG